MPRTLPLLAIALTIYLILSGLERQADVSQLLLVWGSDDSHDRPVARQQSHLLTASLESKPATASHNNKTFSACLLVMDDNHRLSEWIAYHYYALPLRYLVVAVDPQSRTRPSQLLAQWQQYVTIVEWTDSDFTNVTLWRHETDSPDMKKIKHRQRQNAFYQACAWHLHQQNRSWTTFHDTDEFLTINGDVLLQNESSVMQTSGFILNSIQNYAATVEPNRSHWQSHFNQTCITIPRTLYGAVESSKDDVERNVPTNVVDPWRLDTLRWRHRATERGEIEGLAKSVMDVSKISKADFDGGGNAHRVSKRICPSPWIKYKDSPLGIHHYLGGWEAYSFREDARKGTLRSHDVWLERSQLQKGGSDDIMRPWIRGFVNVVGESEARRLLYDAGLPRDYRVGNNVTESWKSIL